jgi:hypothetical protein
MERRLFPRLRTIFARHAGLQGGRKRRQLELLILRFGEDADARERAEYAVELRHPDAGKRRQLIGRARTAFQVIG